ncbi:MAG: phenylacetate-CoA oxygenase subunit PaaC [Pseudomonadota bacterium]|nr:phenylacetate-CoA oxygenase subunit PaaC [Pseudomonadota bacterium]
MNDKFEYALRLGDNALILSHRLSEWCGHGPALEEDIALTNVALDLIGQAQFWLGLAGEWEGAGRGADDLAYKRDAGAFRNALLVERPNGDYGHTLMRQYLFDAWHAELLSALARSSDARFAEIAAKAQREVAYHVERSAELVIALGDGTPQSHARMQSALDALWPYVGELFIGDEIDARLAAQGVAPAADSLRPAWDRAAGAVFAQAGLKPPASAFAHKGGRAGRHTEALGHLLAQMQFLPRAYPQAQW